MKATKSVISILCLVIGTMILASGLRVHAISNESSGFRTQELGKQNVQQSSGIPTSLPTPINLPNLPENFTTSTITPQRLSELEKKYGNKEQSVRELQKKQQAELKAKREMVKSVWKLCEEKIAAYRTTRLDAAKALRSASNCTYQTVDQTLTGEERSTAQKAETLRVSECRKTLAKTMVEFEKETKLQILTIRKACTVEASKPVATSSASTNVQGIEIDEVPSYDFTQLILQ